MFAGTSKLVGAAAAVVVSVGVGGYWAWGEFGAVPGSFGGGGVDKSDDATLQAMITEVQPKFQQFEYADNETGLTVPNNLFVPQGYDRSAPLPVVYFIADSSVVGRDVIAPLAHGYGGLIWATDADQAQHPSLMQVPEFPEVKAT